MTIKIIGSIKVHPTPKIESNEMGALKLQEEEEKGQSS